MRSFSMIQFNYYAVTHCSNIGKYEPFNVWLFSDRFDTLGLTRWYLLLIYLLTMNFVGILKTHSFYSVLQCDDIKIIQRLKLYCVACIALIG